MAATGGTILIWQCRNREFACGERTLVAGVLNVTPDSFSDGGRHEGPEAAVDHAMEMLDEGADMIDIGGESTRPGSDPAPLEEELRRVIPVVRGIRARGDCPISVDTAKAEVARQALEEGADIINDVTALRGDPAMAEVVAASGAGVVLMHMRGTPRTMQKSPTYENVVGEVQDFLSERIRAAVARGVDPACVCVDPGIGFGKTLDHNLALIGATSRLRERLTKPVLLGMSRKSFIGAILGLDVTERLEGSLAAAVAGVLAGADIVRVHDVRATRRAVAVADALRPHWKAQAGNPE